MTTTTDHMSMQEIAGEATEAVASEYPDLATQILVATTAKLREVYAGSQPAQFSGRSLATVRSDARRMADESLRSQLEQESAQLEPSQLEARRAHRQRLVRQIRAGQAEVWD